MSSTPVRVRIAPSPTGDPHVGTAYVALFNYAFARRHGGQFILRIEDTDRARSTRESEEAILRSLAWLGLAWDEGPDVGGPCGPYRQSERAAIYQEHAARLVEREAAYRCFCTEARLEQMRAEQRAAKLASAGYDGACRAISREESDRRARAGEAHVVRLRMPKEGETVVPDRLRGEVRIPNERSDDQVLLKSDGLPTYHLANVVDDHLMGITHVIRAEEWIPSTPKHLRLYEAFGWEPPVFCHLPLLRNNDKNKSKISKRKNPVSLDYYRDSGILPKAMLNFLALMGWSFGEDREKFSLGEMIERFDIAPGSISLSGPVFDLEKLSWLNSLYLHELTDEQLVDELVAWRLNREFLVKLARLARERVRRLDEFVPLTEFFFSGDLDYAPVADLCPKNRTPAETAKLLDQLAEELDAFRVWAPEPLEPFFRAFCEKTGWSTKELFMVVRLVVTGRKASPPLFDTLCLVGRERCRRRIRQAAEFLRHTS
ncbi:MAG: glutamate--tRNA ligase [Deltaproteobacteria bacterium]|nr:glutamate--tRNA ligase [Deltaproteobacteria bacterium]